MRSDSQELEISCTSRRTRRGHLCVLSSVLLLSTRPIQPYPRLPRPTLDSRGDLCDGATRRSALYPCVPVLRVGIIRLICVCLFRYVTHALPRGSESLVRSAAFFSHSSQSSRRRVLRTPMKSCTSPFHLYSLPRFSLAHPHYPCSSALHVPAAETFHPVRFLRLPHPTFIHLSLHLQSVH